MHYESGTKTREAIIAKMGSIAEEGFDVRSALARRERLIQIHLKAETCRTFDTRKREMCSLISRQRSYVFSPYATALSAAGGAEFLFVGYWIIPLVRHVNPKQYGPKSWRDSRLTFLPFSQASTRLIPIMAPQCALQLFHLASSDMNVGALTK